MAALSAASCQPEPVDYDPALAPTVDRMMTAYPDLAGRRFLVLADFETPEQATLFRRHSRGDAHPIAVSVEQAQRETGVGSLPMVLENGSDRIVAVDAPDRPWSLHRDWSGYHLLLFSVFSPRDLGGFTFTLRSGTEMPLTYVHPPVFLTAGWNLVRVDLGTVAEVADLHDVRELAFGCERLDMPTELYLDDLILVDNEAAFFGSPDGNEGELYVTQRGRRLVVGACGHFELTFLDGQVAQWFDLAHDPGRIHNLAGPGPLGPAPVVLTGTGEATGQVDDLASWSGLGLAVDTFQSVIEASPLRVVVAGERRFGAPGETMTDRHPAHRWRYTIYRDGRLYVECTGTARTSTFVPPALGVAFCVDRDQNFTRDAVAADPPDDAQADGSGAGPGAPSYMLWSRDEPGRADLLVVPSTPLSFAVAPPDDAPRCCAVWMLPETGERFFFAAMLHLHGAKLDTPAAARPIADDYVRPLPIGIDVGRLVRTDGGDFNNDGFSEGRGYYVLQLDGSVAKIRLRARPCPRFAPTFRLVDVALRDVWIYVNGRELTDAQRTDDGDLLWTVGDVLAGELLIEIVSRPREGGD